MLHKRKNSLHIVESLLKLLVCGVLPGVRGKFLAVLEELVDALLHAEDLASDVHPGSLLPPCNRFSDLQVESIEFVQFVELILSLDKGGVAFVRQSEEILTSGVRFVFTVMHRELLLEVLQFVQGLAGAQVGLHRSVLLKVLTENLNFNDERLNVLDQLLFEARLIVMKLVTDSKGFANEFVPLFLEVLTLVKFITIHLERVLDESVHVRDRLELKVDVGLLFADLFEGKHNATK